MKKLYTLIYMLGCTSFLYAQNPEEGTFLVKEKNAERVGNDLVITLKADISSLEISRNQSLVCTPLVESGDSVRALTPIVINGKVRHILYERMERDGKEELEIRRYNDTEQQVDYLARTPYADWMEKADVTMVMDDCGCGWKALSQNKSPLFALNFAEPVVIDPMLVYVKPAPEAVKARHLDGSAYLDFPVNQTAIHPDYRNNPAELKKIQQTVEAVKNDPYATITSLSIKGYASPEGTYKGNAYLAENRAKALLNYVKDRYDLSGVKLSVDFEPEDWEGLEAAVEKGNLPDKEELLAIIRADEPADWDAREWKLKTLNGGTSYKVLLRDVYPALRHSDYRVNYNIRNFTVDEAKQIIQSDPSKLSLNEMFLVAETYETGSEPFNEVFEVAVRMYPDDPVSNLNAAISAVNTRQLDKAKRYLAKVNDCPEKQLAEASILMLEGKMDEAEKLLNLQAADPAIADAAQKNLDQINAKRKE